MSRDGRRFIMLKDIGDTLETSARDELTIVLNWFEELRERAKPTAIGAATAR